jgi:hypothetical protein
MWRSIIFDGKRRDMMRDAAAESIAHWMNFSEIPRRVGGAVDAVG